MPEKKTRERARKTRRAGKSPSTRAGKSPSTRAGKSPSTQAGEFVREEIHHVREGKHGARSPKQAIAIGLSKARRAGVKLRRPKPGSASAETIERAERDAARGRRGTRRPSPRRSRATKRALRREGREAARPRALSRQARSAARKRRRSNTRRGA